MMLHVRHSANDKRRWRAFTLVELLVVISIIALLLSVLMPSLGRAREQAKTLMCMANCKQFATIIAVYHAESDGKVPMVFNPYAVSLIPAKYSLLSLAFQKYSTELRNLPSSIDPERKWRTSTRQEYVEDYLPKFFICPFVRGGPLGELKADGEVKIGGKSYSLIKRTGREETFSTWSQKLKKGAVGTNYGTSGTDGIVKYGALTWHKGFDLGYNSSESIAHYKEIAKLPVKWDTRRAKEVGGSGLSDVTVAFCNQGQTDCWADYGALSLTNGIHNYKSHRKGSGGGTNAIFGDMHVGWVPGLEIGWP